MLAPEELVLGRPPALLGEVLAGGERLEVGVVANFLDAAHGVVVDALAQAAVDVREEGAVDLEERVAQRACRLDVVDVHCASVHGVAFRTRGVPEVDFALEVELELAGRASEEVARVCVFGKAALLENSAHVLADEVHQTREGAALAALLAHLAVVAYRAAAAVDAPRAHAVVRAYLAAAAQAAVIPELAVRASADAVAFQTRVAAAQVLAYLCAVALPAVVLLARVGAAEEDAAALATYAAARVMLADAGPLARDAVVAPLVVLAQDVPGLLNRAGLSGRGRTRQQQGIRYALLRAVPMLFIFYYVLVWVVVFCGP